MKIRSTLIACIVCDRRCLTFPSHARRLYCSMTCRNADMRFVKRGASHYRWKGGSTLPLRIRNTEQYRIWRRSCMARDAFRCRICGLRGQLEVDHFVPFALLLQFGRIASIESALAYAPLWALNNGLTLCHSCHRRKPQQAALRLWTWLHADSRPATDIGGSNGV